MNILSIQSWVAYGHVGNASAVFPLQRLGAEVWSINTVQFSNHTGYGHWTGQVYTGDAVRDLVDGIAARDVLRHCDAVLSGYMGDAGIGEAILHAVTRVREENPRAIYCCDPVIGDTEEGVYVREGIDELADGVVTVGFVARCIVNHACENLQRDTRCEAGHHRIGNEVPSLHFYLKRRLSEATALRSPWAGAVRSNRGTRARSGARACAGR